MWKQGLKNTKENYSHAVVKANYVAILDLHATMYVHRITCNIQSSILKYISLFVLESQQLVRNKLAVWYWPTHDLHGLCGFESHPGQLFTTQSFPGFSWLVFFALPLYFVTSSLTHPCIHNRKNTTKLGHLFLKFLCMHIIPEWKLKICWHVHLPIQV